MEEAEHTVTSGCGCGGAGGRVWQPNNGVKRMNHAQNLAEWASPQSATIYLGHQCCKGG